MNGRWLARHFRRSTSRLACALSLVLMAGTASSQVIYVDDSATGTITGLSWCGAYRTLQDALTAAASSGGTITEIRVAQGTYKPDVGSGQVALSRASTFRLRSGVAVRGGYAGCGVPNPDARNLQVYATVLTGDLAGNDLGDRFHDTRAENAYHVVTGSGTDATAILEGLVITAGQASGTGTNGDGAGLYNDGGSPTITNCVFKENYAIRHGGAIRNWRSSHPTITNCRIIDNSGDYGGGLNNTTQSSPVISGCEIARNTCGYHGAGVYNDFSSAPQLIACTFTDNESYYNGGGVANYNQSHATFLECRFERNESLASVGGGMFNDHSHPTLTDCVFEGNKAVFSGGGLSSVAGAPKVYQTTFRGNRANHGGGMIADGAGTLVHNCLMEGNIAVFDGGGLYNLGAGMVTILNTTFVKNQAGRFGGGVFNSGNNPVMTNAILWNNVESGGSGESAQVRGGVPVVNHSCVQGWSGVLGGVGNHGLDPRFTSGAKGCYYLSQWGADSSVQSPCVDAGSDMAANLTLESMTTRADSQADVNLVDLGYHYPIVDAFCGPGNFACHHRIDLRDLARLQSCFGGSASGVLCCEQFDVDGAFGVTLGDAALLMPAMADP